MTAPFNAAQEARLRAIVREEMDDDRALRNSRDHAEYLAQRGLYRTDREQQEAKRAGITVTATPMSNGSTVSVWRRHGVVMTPREVDRYLRARSEKATPPSLLRRLASAARRWATHGGAWDGR